VLKSMLTGRQVRCLICLGCMAVAFLIAMIAAYLPHSEKEENLWGYSSLPKIYQSKEILAANENELDKLRQARNWSVDGILLGMRLAGVALLGWLIGTSSIDHKVRISVLLGIIAGFNIDPYGENFAVILLPSLIGLMGSVTIAVFACLISEATIYHPGWEITKRN